MAPVHFNVEVTLEVPDELLAGKEPDELYLGDFADVVARTEGVSVVIFETASSDLGEREH